MNTPNKSLFESEYAKRSGIELAELLKSLEVVPCDCGQDDCGGWQMVPRITQTEAGKIIPKPNESIVSQQKTSLSSTQTDWQNRFREKFNVVIVEDPDINGETSGPLNYEIEAFISTERKLVIEEVKALVEKLDIVVIADKVTGTAKKYIEYVDKNDLLEAIEKLEAR